METARDKQRAADKLALQRRKEAEEAKQQRLKDIAKAKNKAIEEAQTLRSAATKDKPLEDAGPWIKAPFGGFILGDPFTSLSEQLQYESKEFLAKEYDDLSNADIAPVIELIKSYEAEQRSILQSQDGASARGYMGHTDSSIGGNDALNPYWQFNIDDDIIWPCHMVSKDRGLGRVYSETYNMNQHILWLSFGTPKFAPLADFYKEAGNSKLSAILSDSEHGLGYKIGALVGNGIKLAIKLPWYPLIGICKAAEKTLGLLTEIKINKYYEMVPRMNIYHKAVDTILAHLTVGLNLVPNADDDVDVGRIQNNAHENLRHGPDLLHILSKRARWGYTQLKNANASIAQKEVDALIEANAAEEKSAIFDILNDSIMKEYQYVGFRIERGTDSSESISNSTGEAEIASKLNGMAGEAREKQFMISNGNLDDSALGKALSAVKTGIEGLAEKVGNIAGIGDAITLIAKGSGYFDIPEVWKDSNFSKSYTFDIQLRSRYGDPLSIYNCIYVPLAMLIAGAFPIGVGKNTYTSPFLCQAFSKGMFSIPTGIIESMTIRRGLPEHGWTHEHLPTAVDVSISIKDLSPTMYLSLMDADLVKWMGNNDSMKMYLNTLAGLSVNDLTHKFALMNRRRKAMLLINKATNWNPRWHMLGASNNRLIKAAASFRPAKAFKAPKI